MLVIKIRDEVLTFNSPEGKWVSSNKLLAATPNALIPEDFESHHAVFFDDGSEG